MKEVFHLGIGSTVRQGIGSLLRIGSSLVGSLHRLSVSRHLALFVLRLHFWTVFLEHVFGPSRLLLKILLDQTIFSLYLNGAYAALTETLKGSRPAAIWQRVKASSWPSLRASWRFWPAGVRRPPRYFCSDMSMSPLVVRVTQSTSSRTRSCPCTCESSGSMWSR